MSMMNTQTKDRYISPECEVLDVQPEGMIALSPGKYPQSGEENI